MPEPRRRRGRSAATSLDGDESEPIIGFVMVRLDCGRHSPRTVCGRAEEPGDAPPGRCCAATMAVASTTVLCEVVAYFPERWFSENPCRCTEHRLGVSAWSGPPPAQTVTSTRGVSDPPENERGARFHVQEGGRSRPDSPPDSLFGGGGGGRKRRPGCCRGAAASP